MAMTKAARQYTRHKLYELLTALHSGPLGVELIPQIRRTAEALGMRNLPETPGPFPANLHRWTYGYCPGNPQLGCEAASPSGCLPAKFSYLAGSAHKTTLKRQRLEADFIENELLPCLQTNHGHMEIEAYRDVVALSMAVAAQDAAMLREQLQENSVRRQVVENQQLAQI